MADTLSGGEQQMLAVARAMMTGGKLMLLDEPSMGLAPFLMYDLFRVLKEINRQGTTILLVEQNARIALKILPTGPMCWRPAKSSWRARPWSWQKTIG